MAKKAKKLQDLPDGGNLYVISWDNLGVEGIIPVTDILENDLFEAIKTGKSTGMSQINHTVNMMTMRARYNSQRHYEIYTITTSKDITAADLQEQFDMNPQGMADLVRKRGNKLYSDRLEPSNCKIV